MRRPLKPFVTEYKQSNRRNSTEPSDQGTIDTERSAQKTADFAFKEPEDSYEAAMRAADALFSTPSEGKPRPQAAEPLQAEPQIRLSETMQKPEKSGGRILRVIDEEPLPQFAALEAERAPKRRGRKPGSKNKPKVALVSAEAELGDQSASSASIVTFLPKSVTTMQPNAEVRNASVAPRSGKRTPWSGNRVRPGEDWKRRRLPKVCW